MLLYGGVILHGRLIARAADIITTIRVSNMHGFFAGGWRLFWDSNQMRVKQTVCNPHPSRGVWGHGPPQDKIFKIAALTLTVNQNKYH